MQVQTDHKAQKNTGDLLIRVLAITLVISVMNGTMFNVVLPEISKQFSLSSSQVSWFVTSFLIVYAIGTVTFGKLTDKYSLKKLMTFGLLLLSIGSFVGMFANAYWMMIVARILQGIGASVIPALAMIIPVRYFSPEKRGRALGTSAIGIALGSAFGPIIAGFVSTAWNWQFLFAIPLLSLFTLPFYHRYLDDEKTNAAKIDFIGGLLLAGTVTALLLSLSNGKIEYAVVGVILLPLFILRIRNVTNPFVNPAIFRNKQYSMGLAITFVMTAVGFGIPYMTPMLLSQVDHISPAVTGLIMFPSAIVTAFLGRKGGRLADEKGNSFLFYTASTLLFFGFICLSSVVGFSPFFVMFFLIFGVLGDTYKQIAMSNIVSQTLPKDQVGIGMGLLSMFNFIASATSTALIGRVLDFGTTTFHINPITQNSSSFIFSNIFLVLAILILVVTGIFHLQFGSISKRNSYEIKKGGGA